MPGRGWLLAAHQSLEEQTWLTGPLVAVHHGPSDLIPAGLS